MAVVDMEQTYQRRDALMARLFQATLGFFDIYAIYLGNTLGLYRVLLQLGPMTAADLATRASADPRYVREWLEQQAASGVLDVAEPDAGDENVQLEEGKRLLARARRHADFRRPGRGADGL